MKVLMVTPFYPPVIGGTESFIQSTSAKLNEIGVSTDILTFNLDDYCRPVWETRIDESSSGSRIIKIAGRNSIRPTKLVQVSMIPGLFQSYMKDYDVIHYHNETDLSLPFFSYFVKKPKILHCHCLDVSYPFYRKNPVSRLVFKKVSDIHVAVSKSIESLLIDLGIDERKIRVVPNGVDTDTFRPDKRIKADNLLLFAGRLHPNKGLHVLLKALEHLKKPVELVVIGPKLSYCPDYYTELLSSVEHLNKTTNHKVSLVGVQTHEELVRWYQRATIFVCPSISEPFGIVNLEALSCETPVIASNVGGIPEVVKNEKNGLLVRPSAPEELTKAIQFLLDNKSLKEKFGREGRVWVEENFSSEAVAKHLLKIYEALIAK